jgi:hypothetical protein
MSGGPPELCNIEIEEAVLGCLLIDPDAYAQIAHILTPADFFVIHNGWIFDAIGRMVESGTPVEFITLVDELQRQGRLEESGGAAYITRLINAEASAMHVVSYAHKVREWSRRRQLVATAEDLVVAAHSTNGHHRELAAAVLERGSELLTSTNALPVSAGELLSDTTLSPRDFVEGFIGGKSVHLVSGDGGVGKSLAMLDLAFCVSHGVPWLGLRTRQTPVLFLDLENHPTRVRDRIRLLLRGHNLAEPPPVSFKFELNSRFDSNAAVIEVCHLANKCQARLIILDSLVDFLGETDENSNSEMGCIAQRLRAVAKRLDGSLVVIHHSPKGGLSVRGASALLDGADIGVLVARDGNMLTLKQAKNRNGPEMTVRARLNWGDGFNLSPLDVAVGRPERSPDPDEAAIQKILSDGDWHESSEVVKQAIVMTGRKRSTLHNKLRLMARDGVVVRQDQGPGQPYLVRRLDGSGDE